MHSVAKVPNYAVSELKTQVFEHGIKPNIERVYLPTFPYMITYLPAYASIIGQCNVKQYNAYLRDLIIAGRAKPSFVVSHQVPLDQAPEAYTKFDRREDGYTKVILQP